MGAKKRKTRVIDKPAAPQEPANGDRGNHGNHFTAERVLVGEPLDAHERAALLARDAAFRDDLAALAFNIERDEHGRRLVSLRILTDESLADPDDFEG